MSSDINSPIPSNPSSLQRSDSYKLVVRYGEFKGLEYHLPLGDVLLGRWDPETGSFPEVNLESIDLEARISRRHAIVSVELGRVSLQDLNSLNGTYVNYGSKLPPGVRCSLQVNDEILLGKTILQLQAE